MNIPKIILHNVTLKGIENVPGVLNFDERGLVIANNGDIVITRSPADEFFLDYLKNLGYNFSACTFYNSKSEVQTYDSIFKEAELITLLKNSPAELISSYQLTRYEDDLAKETGKILYGNVNLSEKYGTKSGFRELCKDLHISIVNGYEHLKDIGEINKKIELVSTKKCLMRLDEGVSGAGNFLIETDKYAVMSQKDKDDLIRGYLNKLPQRMSDSGATIEEWIDDVKSSPSLQFEVARNGEIKLLSTHDQLLEGKEKWYVGCSYPSSTLGSFYDQVVSDGFKFMNSLKLEGFYGFCGIDLIVTNDKYYFVEANVRVPGTTYPREFVKKVFGDLENIHYMAKDFQLDNLKGKNFKTIYEKLNPLLIGDNRQEGVLVYNTGSLRLGGRVDVVIVSKDLEKRQHFLEEINKNLREI